MNIKGCYHNNWLLMSIKLKKLIVFRIVNQLIKYESFGYNLTQLLHNVLSHDKE